MAARLEAAGVGAIVLPSLFEEEIVTEELELNRSLEQGTEHFAEALDYFPAVDRFIGAADRYLAAVERIKSRAAVPIIASLNATSTGGWVRYARLIQDAGADALELNLYHVAADPRRTATDMEAADLDLIAAVRAAVAIPLAVKLSPVLLGVRPLRCGGDRGRRRRSRAVQSVLPAGYRPGDARGRAAARSEPALGDAAAGALDRDPATAARPRRVPRCDLRRPGRDGRGQGLMVGADVVMMTSALLRHGPEHVATVEAELRAWLTEHEYESVDQLRGSASQATTEDPSAFERANYMHTLRSWVAPRDLTPTAPSRPADCVRVT